MWVQKYLVLHRSEWERIKKHCQTKHETVHNEEHLKRMHELSQKWIKTWPDTVEGHVELFKKNERLNRKKDLMEIKTFALRKLKDNSAVVVEKARQQLFNDSCYGRQLISCLIESKTLEERDAQLEFKNKLKDKAILNEKEIITQQSQRLKEAEINEGIKLEDKKNRAKKIAKVNKAMHEMLIKKRTRDQKIQKRHELENLSVVKKILDEEKQHEVEDKFNSNKNVYQENTKLDEERNQKREMRKKEQEQMEKIEEVWRRYNERVACRLKLMQEKKETADSLKKQVVYDNLEMIKKKENSKYDEFIEKGIRHLEKSLLDMDKESELAKKKDKDFSVPKKINQKTNEKAKLCPKFCKCDRQTLICKSSEKKQKTHITQKGQESSGVLPSSKSLVEDLRRREKEPSPWNGTESAHQQFTKQAAKTLEECRYKTMALKVITKYKKDNLLVSDSSPIANY